MAHIEQIQEDLKGVSEEIVRAKEDKKTKDNPWESIPELGPLYVKAASNLLDLSVHIFNDFFPTNLFREKAPFQEQIEFEWLKANYRSISNIVPNEFFGVTNRIFNRNNWSIQYRGFDELQEYLDETYPIYKDFFGFYATSLFKKQIVDPNGVVTVKPYRPETNEEGQILTDQEVRPIATYHSTFQNIAFSEDEFLLVLTDRKTFVEQGGKQQKVGLVYEFYDKEWIREIRQVGKRSDFTFEVIDFFFHDLGFLPARPLGNDPEIIKGEIFFRSKIQSVVDPLDIVSLDNSTLQLSKGKTAYPIKIAPEEPCDNEHCNNGFINDGEGETRCGRCNGTGNLHSDSPSTTYRVRQPRGLDSDKNLQDTVMNPPIQFVSPDPEILTFLDTQIDKNMDKARSLLRLNKQTDEANANLQTTATGAAIDRDDQFAFIKGFSNDGFELMEWLIDTQGKMRFGDRYEKPVITEPDSFAIRTSQDITREIAETKESGIPDVYTDQLIKEAMDKRFNMDELNQKIIDLQIFSDKIVNKNEKEISTLIAQQRLLKWEIVLHDSFVIFTQDAVKADNKFFQKDLDVQRDVIIGMAQTKAAELDTVNTQTAEINNESNTADLGGNSGTS